MKIHNTSLIDADSLGIVVARDPVITQGASSAFENWENVMTNQDGTLVLQKVPCSRMHGILLQQYD